VDFLQECQGQLIHVELRKGDLYSGYLSACDPFMNLSLTTVVYTRDTDTAQLDAAMIRGSAVKFVSMLNAMHEAVGRRMGRHTSDWRPGTPAHKSWREDHQDTRAHRGTGGRATGWHSVPSALTSNILITKSMS
jgi:small nuclear ribonucleoprotein (snRNP)-like protein